MSHFVVVTLLDRPSADELAMYEPTAAVQSEVQAEVEARALGSTHPITGDAKVLRTWAEYRLNDVLEPFSENEAIEPYEEECWCVGRQAKAFVNEQLREERPDLYNLDERRRRFGAIRLLQGSMDIPDPDWGMEAHPSNSREALISSEQDQGVLRELGLGKTVDRVLGPDWLRLSRDEKAKAQVTAVDEHYHKEWKAMWALRERLERERFEEHPLKDVADPLCSHYKLKALGLEDHFNLVGTSPGASVLDVGIFLTNEDIIAAYELEVERIKNEELEQTEILPGHNERRTQERLAYLEECRDMMLDPERRAEYLKEGDGDDGCMGTGIATSTYPRKIYRWRTAAGEIVHEGPESSKPPTDQGELTSTVIRGAEWDWWVVGGRWAGFFKPDYNPGEDARNYGPCRFCNETGLVNADGPPYHAAEPGDETQICHVCEGTKVERLWRNAEVEYDVVPAKQWLDELEAGQDVVPYAVVTPDGEFHQRGKMGWWGMASDEQERAEWCERVLELARKHAPGRMAIAVDMHI